MKHFELCPDCKRKAMGITRPTMADIKRAVAKATGVSVDELTSQRRTTRIVRARYVAIALCGRLAGHSSATIGKAFGNRDHSTMLHALHRMRDAVESLTLSDDAPLAEWVSALNVYVPAVNYHRRRKPIRTQTEGV